jgi:hypothetical protein
MKTKELVSISNQLSNDDLVKLVNLMSNRLCVFVERDQARLVEIDFACLNGDIVQINLIDQEDEEHETL